MGWVTEGQICNILGTILEESYFAFQDHCYQPDKGVAMGSPLSGTMAEIFFSIWKTPILNPSWIQNA